MRPGRERYCQPRYSGSDGGGHKYSYNAALLLRVGRGLRKGEKEPTHHSDGSVAQLSSSPPSGTCPAVPSRTPSFLPTAWQFRSGRDEYRDLRQALLHR